MKKKSLLIICYDLKDFQVIEKLDKYDYEIIVVASDDYRIHELCNQHEYIDEVTFLQKPIPYTVVAKEVIGITHRINEYYKQVSAILGVFKTEHMVLPYHVEGGNNTQKIQDTLLYIQSLTMIIDQHKTTKIITLSNSNYQQIEQVVYQICVSKNISYQTVKKLEIAFSKKRLKNFIRPFFYLYRTVSIKIKNIFKRKEFETNVALFWFFNAVKKHIDNAVFIDSVLKKSGLNPVLFSWRVARIKNQNNINIQPIEKYLHWRDILISIWKNIQVVIYQKKLMKEYSKYSFSYLGIDITNIIYPIVRYHIFVEAADSYRFSKGFHIFKQYMDIKVMAGDLGSQKIGLLVENNFSEDMAKFSFSTFLTGKNIYVEYMRQQYNDKYWDNFKYFVQNEIEKNNILGEVNLAPNNVVVYGSFRASPINDIYKIKDEAFKKLGIRKEYDYYIMFDYPNQLNGYQSLEESVLTLIAVLDLVKDRKDIALLIKPHPSADMGFFNIIKAKFKYSNIYFMNKSVNPVSVLGIADILITKYSTLGIEAMSLNTIVVSMQLDNSRVFRLFGEDAIYINSITKLKEKINIMTASLFTFQLLKDNEDTKNKQYLSEIYVSLDESVIIKNINWLLKGK